MQRNLLNAEKVVAAGDRRGDVGRVFAWDSKSVGIQEGY